MKITADTNVLARAILQDKKAVTLLSKQGKATRLLA